MATKKHQKPKSILAAINAANRQEEIEMHGKSIVFRPLMTKNKKKYSRKTKFKDARGY